MKRTIYSVLMTAVLFLTVFVMTGCKQDQNSPEQPSNVPTYRMCVAASKGSDAPMNGPHKVLSLDGTTLNAAWTEGEQVSVYNATKGADLGGYLEAQSSGASVQLEGDLTGTVEAGDRLTLRFLSPVYTDQQGTLAYISANCDYAVAENVEVASVSGGRIHAANDAVFANRQAIIRFTLTDAADGTTLLNPTVLVIHDGTSDIATLTSIPASTYTTNGDGVLYVAVPGFSGKNITLTATVGADTYRYEKANATLTNGSYYKLAIEMSKQGSASPSSGIGLFSVSATQQVTFSPGNLQYQASTDTWRFAEHQWDIVGMGYGQTNTSDHCYIGGTVANSDNRQIGSSYSGWIDLFGWGTSGWNSGANAYQPYSTSTSYRDYYPGGSSSNSLTGNYANADWGVYNQIGDDAPGSWRTLTKDEWNYLFKTRANASSKYGAAKVNGVTGVVVLPDNWVLPVGCGFTAGMTSASSWYDWSYVATTNIYTSAQWQLMESAGAVFLPAAGYRNGTSVYLTGSYGSYWSSTQNDSGYAYELGFGTSSLDPQYGNNRGNGFSVRLVQVLMN